MRLKPAYNGRRRDGRDRRSSAVVFGPRLLPSAENQADSLQGLFLASDLNHAIVKRGVGSFVED
jgi:hypothetical protein